MAAIFVSFHGPWHGLLVRFPVCLPTAGAEACGACPTSRRLQTHRASSRGSAGGSALAWRRLFSVADLTAATMRVERGSLRSRTVTRSDLQAAP